MHRLSVTRVRHATLLCTDRVHMGSALHAAVPSESHGTRAARRMAVDSRLCHSDSLNALLICSSGYV
jgi:hypothetical protein